MAHSQAEVESASHQSTPKSSHLTDPALKPFLASKFDPAEYFNTTLPALSASTAPSRRASASSTNTASLAELSTTTQTLLSQLNAQTTRLSNVLTQLTDDILRSGGRLAYQVEVLRGETAGLSETLADKLHTDIARFAPQTVLKKPADQSDATPGETEPDVTSKEDTAAPAPDLPPYLTQLRTLTLVRQRLESVINIFGEAMQWTIPPSEVSLTSSLISVSAPEPGSDSHSREEKGREFAEKLRSEIGELMAGSNAGGGYDAAMVRIQALRELAAVWKGTAEEKARGKFVDGLVKLAEEKQRALERAPTGSQKTQQPRRQSASTQATKQSTNKGGGFLENLQRMRGSYLDG